MESHEWIVVNRGWCLLVRGFHIWRCCFWHGQVIPFVRFITTWSTVLVHKIITVLNTGWLPFLCEWTKVFKCSNWSAFWQMITAYIQERLSNKLAKINNHSQSTRALIQVQHINGEPRRGKPWYAVSVTYLVLSCLFVQSINEVANSYVCIVYD